MAGATHPEYAGHPLSMLEICRAGLVAERAAMGHSAVRLTAGFFALGLVFCNLVILPLVIHFFVSFGMDRKLTPQLAVGIISISMLKFLLVFGFASQLPLALTLLARMGCFQSRACVLPQARDYGSTHPLRDYHAGRDPLYHVAHGLPLIILYEIGIWARDSWEAAESESERAGDEPQRHHPRRYRLVIGSGDKTNPHGT